MSALTGISFSLATVCSGLIYARIGEGVYYAMAAMALAGGLVMGIARKRLDAHRAVID